MKMLKTLGLALGAALMMSGTALAGDCVYGQKSLSLANADIGKVTIKQFTPVLQGDQRISSTKALLPIGSGKTLPGSEDITGPALDDEIGILKTVSYEVLGAMPGTMRTNSVTTFDSGFGGANTFGLTWDNGSPLSL